MRVNCPHCWELVVQTRNVEGLNYCPACHKLFLVPPEAKVPGWVWGVVVVLLVNWQILHHTVV